MPLPNAEIIICGARAEVKRVALAQENQRAEISRAGLLTCYPDCAAEVSEGDA
jgi:hypothetical protein